MDEMSNVKQTILATSLTLFSEKGYEGVSVSELTAAAGITKPTLYYYFGNKEGVFDAVCEVNYALLNAVIADNAVYCPNPESYYEDIFKTLKSVTNAYFKFAIENEPFYRLTMANLSMPRSGAVFGVVQKYHFKQYEVIEDMFRAMAESHANLKDKSKQLTWSLIGAINSFIGLTFNGISEGAFDEVTTREFVRQFMHGIYA
jgi:AcrR family transcriptional regulator